jgi:hypothetical protein
VNRARRDLCGGCAEMRIPTAIVLIKIGRQTLSTLASTLLDLCFLVTDLCPPQTEVCSNCLKQRHLLGPILETRPKSRSMSALGC